MRLTPAGRGFLPEARAILRLAESASLSAQRISRGEAGSLAIGFTASTGYRFLPDLIVVCRERLPGVELVLKEMVTMEQVEALASGGPRRRAYCAPAPRWRTSRRAVLRANRWWSRSPHEHPLAKGRAPTLEDFDHAAFLTYSPIEARYFHDLVAGTFSVPKCIPTTLSTLHQIHSILALVRAGLGAALIPEAAMSLRFEGVVVPRAREAPSGARTRSSSSWRGNGTTRIPCSGNSWKGAATTAGRSTRAERRCASEHRTIAPLT